MSGDKTRTVTVRAGAFAEHRISSARYTTSTTAWAGSDTEYIHTEPLISDAQLAVGGPWLDITLPTSSQIELTLGLDLRAYRPSYRRPDQNQLHAIEESSE